MFNIGDVVLRYRVLELVERGGTGLVYKALNTANNQVVALKVFPWGTSHSSDLARLRKDVAAVQALQHPNICRVAAIDAVDDVLCVEMEMLSGTSLDVLPKPLEVNQVIAYALDIVAAFEAAHARGILHGDFKSSKVVLSDSGIKIVDFGVGTIRRMVRSEQATLFQRISEIASCASPEQVNGVVLDARSDLYSFGCVLYEMATGEPPFTGAIPADLIQQIVSGAPPAPSTINAAVPPLLSQIILKALEKDRAARFQSATELRASLREVLPLTGDPQTSTPRSPGPVAHSGGGPAAAMDTKTIGRYEIIRRIGSGGMGIVYAARDPQLDRVVAIKKLPASADVPDAPQRLLNEAQAHARLYHPNIVEVFDVFEVDGSLFIAMEYVEGRTLADMVRRQTPMDLEHKLLLMEQLCAGLHYAHKNGVIHRDLNPANVIVDRKGGVKIVDFGIAPAGAPADDRPGFVFGTIAYVAPEQLKGLAVDPRVDMFAAGAVFYELLTYRRAFPGDASVGILQRILNGDFKPLTEIDPSLDRELVSIVHRCLATNPEQRFADMGVVRAELAGVRLRLVQRPMRLAESVHALDAQTEALERTNPTLIPVPLDETVHRWRRPWVRQALTAAVVLAIGTLGLVEVGRFRQQTRVRSVTPTPASSSTAFSEGPQVEAAARLDPYYALVIGNNDYKVLPPLRTPINDARTIEETLRLRYGFVTEILTNVTRYELMTAISNYRLRLGANSNFLVYYAGHGYYDKDADKAYWLPLDAQPDNTANWIIADDITTAIRVIPARHVMVVSDSCYSGGLVRDGEPTFTPQQRERFLEKMWTGKSRTLLASGGNEPVSDSGGNGNHSVFAAALISAFNTIETNVFTGHELFDPVEKSVGGKSQQTPVYSMIRNSGHDSGDFVFVRNSGQRRTASAEVIVHTPLGSTPGPQRAQQTIARPPEPESTPTAPPSPMPVATGGRIVWTGRLAPGDQLTINGGRASTGKLAGVLPEAPVNVEISPRTLKVLKSAQKELVLENSGTNTETTVIVRWIRQK